MAVEDLVLKLTRRDTAAAVAPACLSQLEDRTAWNDFLTLSGRHFVNGLALSKLAALDDLPPDLEAIRRRASAALHRLRLAASLWDLERDRVLHVLELGGGTPLLLKGAALRLASYAEPAHRPIRDVDILVPPHELDGTLRTMRELGYAVPYSETAIRHLREEHFHLRFVREPFTVEVHWDLSRPRQGFRLDASRFLRDARVVMGPTGRSARVPSPEDMILHLSAENLTHGTRLGRLADIDRLVSTDEAPDWDRLFASARRAGLETGLAVDLRLCQVLLGSRVPSGHTERLGVPRRRRHNLALLRPAKWALSRTTAPESVSGVRRYWCLSDRFRHSRKGSSFREDPLMWIWLGERTTAGARSHVKRIRKAVKRFAYQLRVYVEAAASTLSPAGRRSLRFWT